MDSTARALIISGTLILIAGLSVWAVARLGAGRLPGDIFLDRGNFKFAFPLMTSLLISVALTIVLNIAVRLLR